MDEVSVPPNHPIPTASPYRVTSVTGDVETGMEAHDEDGVRVGRTGAEEGLSTRATRRGIAQQRGGELQWCGWERRAGEPSKVSSAFSSSMCTPPRRRCLRPCTPPSFPSPRGPRLRRPGSSASPRPWPTTPAAPTSSRHSLPAIYWADCRHRRRRASSLSPSARTTTELGALSLLLRDLFLLDSLRELVTVGEVGGGQGPQLLRSAVGRCGVVPQFDEGGREGGEGQRPRIERDKGRRELTRVAGFGCFGGAERFRIWADIHLRERLSFPLPPTKQQKNGMEWSGFIPPESRTKHCLKVL
jgi:hypothetical protein